MCQGETFDYTKVIIAVEADSVFKLNILTGKPCQIYQASGLADATSCAKGRPIC